MAASPSFMPNRSLKVYKRASRFFRSRPSSKDHDPSPSPSRLPLPSNSLLGVPAEIKQLIFELLADIPSLCALLSTCSILYCSFYDSESSILARFLQRRIPPSLMHIALATLKSSEPSKWSKQTAEDLVTLYTKTDKSPLLPKLNLRNAHLLSETNGHVQFFANRFATKALSYHPVTCLPELVPTPIRPSELCRIERTLYRFQFYCNLMALRKKSRFGRGPSVISFDGFAPWEDEQLACIKDYLLAAAFLAFKDIGAYSIERMTHIFPFSHDWSALDPTLCLPLGLAFLRRLFDVKTHSERRRLLLAHPLSHKHFRTAWMVEICSSDLPLSMLNEEEERKWIKPPAVYDRDRGPEAAWRWANADLSRGWWYNLWRHYHLREWGFVMWDYDRLDSWGFWGAHPSILREPWDRRFNAR